MKKVLNLSDSFYPVQMPNINFKKMVFSGGEVHINIDGRDINVNEVLITSRCNSSVNIFEILLAADALRKLGVEKLSLFMPYIPYARQDRYCTKGDAFSLKVFANVINSVGFKKIFVLDAHSDVAPALLDNCIQVDYSKYVDIALGDIMKSHGCSEIMLVSPDAGANKKVLSLYKDLVSYSSIKPNLVDILKCDKVRNPVNGSLSGFKAFIDGEINEDCIIVDDICDGGGTFIGLADELKRKGAKKLFLFVTHGIFSKGLDDLSKIFDGIYTTNSISDFKDSRLTQIKIDL